MLPPKVACLWIRYSMDENNKREDAGSKRFAIRGVIFNMIAFEWTYHPMDEE